VNCRRNPVTFAPWCRGSSTEYHPARRRAGVPRSNSGLVTEAGAWPPNYDPSFAKGPILCHAPTRAKRALLPGSGPAPTRFHPVADSDERFLAAQALAARSRTREATMSTGARLERVVPSGKLTGGGSRKIERAARLGGPLLCFGWRFCFVRAPGRWSVPRRKAGPRAVLLRAPLRPAAPSPPPGPARRGPPPRAWPSPPAPPPGASAPPPGTLRPWPALSAAARLLSIPPLLLTGNPPPGAYYEPPGGGPPPTTPPPPPPRRLPTAKRPG